MKKKLHEEDTKKVSGGQEPEEIGRENKGYVGETKPPLEGDWDFGSIGNEEDPFEAIKKDRKEFGQN